MKNTHSIILVNRRAVIAAGVAMLMVSSGFAYAPAYAQSVTTTTDLQAQIASLLAQIQALQAQLALMQGSGATAQFTSDLTIGSRGSQVVALQTWLIAKGYSIPAGATGYFGTQTQAAVAAFQAANGIMPTAGYFGPITRARVNTLIGASSAGTGGTTTGGTTVLAGNGRLTDVTSLGDVTTDLHAGDGATRVVGVSAYATDGDVQIQRLDVNFDIGSAGNQSSNLDRYIGDVSVYLNGTKLASMDASEGDKSSRTWSFRFSDLNGIIKQGQTGNLYVEVTPLSTIGTNEDGRSFSVTIPQDGVRAVGSDGLSETYVSSDITQTGVTVSSATTGTLTVSPAADNPSASQIAVGSSTTSGVTLLSFNMKAKNSDVTINQLAASLNTSDNNLSDVISTIKLMKGSTVLKSKTVSTGSNGTVTFDNLDETIDQDNTQEYSIVADLKADSAYADGTTLTASTTVSGWDVSDGNGATINPSSAVNGNVITLTASGISVALGTPTATVTTAGYSGGLDHATFTIPFTVTAGDNPIWIGGSATATTTANGKTSVNFAPNLGVVFATTTTSSATTSSAITASVGASNTDTNDANGNFYVSANSSRTFTLTVATGATTNNTPNVADRLGIMLTGINYDTTSTMGSTYYTSNISAFKTPDVDVYYHP